jgi:hypothetical protein
MLGIIPLATVYDQSIATNTDILSADVTPSERGCIRITCAMDTKTKLRVFYDDGSSIINMPMNGDVDQEADAPYTYVLGCDPSLSINFRHGDGGTVNISLLLVDLVIGGVV